MRLLLLPLLLVSQLCFAISYQQAPMLSEQVQAGTLPPLEERLPENPSIADFSQKIAGEYGGRIRMLMGKAKEIRMMVVYGYARLVAFDESLELKPDLIESFDVEDGRIFTLNLRKGHRWSDGSPFTAEDFRFWWDHVAMNKELSPFGPPRQMKIDGKAPEFEVINEYSVRFTWEQPNPHFLPALAAPRPLFIYMPAHYMKRYHASFVAEEKMASMVEKAKKRNWRGLFLSKGRQYKLTNPKLPSLQPWVNTTKPPAERFIFSRNPYYHRVDPQGRQLPYVDSVEINIVSSSLIPAKTASGESDLQARHIRMDSYTFLKAGSKQQNYNVNLWETTRGAHMAIYPNLNNNDPVWRKLFQDVRFRRALSMAVNRDEINQVVYFGLARDHANTVLPACTLYEPSLARAWADFDLLYANQLLDEIGLTERDSNGIRLLPDGRPLEILVQTAGESTEETDVLALVADSWKKAGVKLYIKATQREVLRNRVFSGEAQMSVWFGLPNGIPTAEMSPAQLAPTQQEQLQWPKWGRHYETGEGEEPSLVAARELLSLNELWNRSRSSLDKEKIWREMLKIHANQVFSIGLVSATLQPIVVNERLRNVPIKGLFNWEPSSYFGVYRPDTFWFSGESS